MILILGGSGLIGTELRTLLKDQDFLAPTRDECDLLDFEKVGLLIRTHRPKVVINCGAFTNVDQAEHYKYQAYLLNSALVEHVAKVSSEVDSVELVVHISTDYIFGGDESRGKPYLEDDRAGPIQNYGLTKLLGEEFFLRHCQKPYLLVRTSWIYGRARGSFPEAIIRNLSTSSTIPVVCDQYGFPTHAEDVAGFIVRAVSDPLLRGVFHVSGWGEYVPSRFDQAQMIAKFLSNQAGIDLKVNKYLTDELTPKMAMRPTFSALDTAKARALSPQHIVDWKIRLKNHLEELKDRGLLWKSSLHASTKPAS